MPTTFGFSGQTSEPTSSSLFDPAIRSRLAEAIGQAEDQLPSVPYDTALRALRQTAQGDFTTTERLQLLSRLKPALRDVSTAQGAPGALAEMALTLGFKDLARQSLKLQPPETEQKPSGVGVLAPQAHAFWGPMDILDTPHHVIRQLSTPGVEPFDHKISQSEWWNKHRAEADRPGVSKYDAFVRPMQVLGAIPGGVAGAAAAAAGAISDVATGRTQGMGERVWGTIKESAIGSGGELAASIATDPLSYVSAGLFGSAKNAVGAARRLGVASKLKPITIQILEKEVLRAAGAGTATLRADRTLRALRKAGIADDVVKKAFGSGGEFLEKGGVRIGFPFAEDKLGVDVAAIPGEIKRVLGRAPMSPEAQAALEHPIRGAVKSGVDKTVGGGINAYNRVVDSVNAALGTTRQKIAKPYGLWSVEMRDAKESVRRARALNPMVLASIERDGQKIAAMGPESLARREEIILHHIEPEPTPPGMASPPGYIPRAQLTDSEKAWVDEIEKFFEKWQNNLVQAGVLEKDQIARNSVSGMYYPRVYSSAYETLSAGERGAVGGMWRPFKSRKADVSLGAHDASDGSTAVQALVDPNRVIPAYANRVAARLSEKTLQSSIVAKFGKTTSELKAMGIDNWALDNSWIKSGVKTVLGEDIKVPQLMHKLVLDSFDTSLDTLGNLARTRGLHPRFVAGLDALETVRGWFKKRVLLKVPGYHVLNTWDDSIKMATAGMNNVPGGLAEAKGILDRFKAKQAPKLSIETPHMGRLSEARVVRLAHENNIAHGALAEKLDIAGSHANQQKSMVDLMEGASTSGQKWGEMDAFGRYTRGKAYLRKADVLGRPGEAFARGWDDVSKLALFIDRLKKGDGPEKAAEFVFQYLFDYTDRNSATKILRMVMPFGTWQAKAPLGTARAMGRGPGRVLAVKRGLDAWFEGDTEDVKKDYDPGKYVTERGPTYAIGPTGRRTISQFAEAMPGLNAKPLSGGFGMSLLPRVGYSESFAPLLSLLRTGSGNQISQQLAPGIKGTIEAITGQDAYSGRPIGDVLREQGLNLGPAVGAFNRYVAPSLISPIPAQMIHEALFRARGGQEGQSPPNVIGFLRTYAEDPETAFAYRRGNLMTRVPIYQTSPIGAVREAADATASLRRQLGGRDSLPAAVERALVSRFGFDR